MKKFSEVLDKLSIKDSRVLSMAISEVLRIGTEILKKLTDEDVEAEVAATRKKEEEAEKEGKIYLITADFVRDLLNLEREIAQLDFSDILVLIKNIY